MSESPPERDSFVTRAYQPGDETAILGLFHRVFHGDRTLEHWRWKYLDNPWSPAGHGPAISLTFADDGRLAAHYAGYPVPFEDARPPHGDHPRPLLGLQIGDTMTAPGLRHVGRGPTSLLGRTVRHFYETFCERRIDFNYGFNTANIQRFSLRFVGARRIEPTLAWDRWLPDSPIAGRRLASRSLRGIQIQQIREIQTVAESWDELYRRARRDYGVLVRRDAAYARWRHLGPPEGGYRLWAAHRGDRLVAWVAARREEDRLLWGDGLVTQSDASVLFALLDEVARREAPAIRRLTCWSPARPAWWVESLRRHGFVARPQKDDLSLMCVPFQSQDAPTHLLPWAFYQRADSDLY